MLLYCTYCFRIEMEIKYDNDDDDNDDDDDENVFWFALKQVCLCRPLTNVCIACMTFLCLWPWPWPTDLDIRSRPRYSKFRRHSHPYYHSDKSALGWACEWLDIYGIGSYFMGRVYSNTALSTAQPSSGLQISFLQPSRCSHTTVRRDLPIYSKIK